MEQPEYNNSNEEIKFEWKDVVAFTIALYQIVIPYVLAIIASTIIVTYLLFKLWFN